MLRAETDSDAVPGVDGADGDRDLHDLLIGEMRLQRLEGVIGAPVSAIFVTASTQPSSARSCWV